jgi:hypothetical protein
VKVLCCTGKKQLLALHHNFLSIKECNFYEETVLYYAEQTKFHGRWKLCECALVNVITAYNVGVSAGVPPNASEEGNRWWGKAALLYKACLLHHRHLLIFQACVVNHTDTDSIMFWGGWFYMRNYRVTVCGWWGLVYDILSSVRERVVHWAWGMISKLLRSSRVRAGQIRYTCTIHNDWV